MQLLLPGGLIEFNFFNVNLETISLCLAEETKIIGTTKTKNRFRHPQCSLNKFQPIWSNFYVSHIVHIYLYIINLLFNLKTDKHPHTQCFMDRLSWTNLQ